MSLICKKYGVDFKSTCDDKLMRGALTLLHDDVCSDVNITEGTHSRTHESGWTITGELQEDYYVWVNDFHATHPEYGRVWGDFQREVFADSEEGYQHFWINHKPYSWSYWDI